MNNLKLAVFVTIIGLVTLTTIPGLILFDGGIFWFVGILLYRGAIALKGRFS